MYIYTPESNDVRYVGPFVFPVTIESAPVAHVRSTAWLAVFRDIQADAASGNAGRAHLRALVFWPVKLDVSRL